MENLGKFTTIVIGLIISPIISGFVLSKLWLWFITSTFGLDPLRVVECIGLVYILGFINLKYTKTKSDNFWEDYFSALIYLIMYSAFILLAGTIVKSFL